MKKKKYETPSTCPMCNGVNDIEIKGQIGYTVCEAETKCQKCGHDDYWAYGLYTPSQGEEENMEKFDMNIFQNGESVGLFNMSKDEAESYCEKLTEETGIKHDWHYIGGRVHVKREKNGSKE